MLIFNGLDTNGFLMESSGLKEQRFNSIKIN